MNDQSEQRLGTFVTNKWLVAALLALTMSMGGYVFHGIDKVTDTALSQVSAMERRMTAVEVDIAAAQAERRAQYAEILRRLDRIENALYGPGGQHRHNYGPSGL